MAKGLLAPAVFISLRKKAQRKGKDQRIFFNKCSKTGWVKEQLLLLRMIYFVKKKVSGRLHAR
jgi:hypothetical protein